jgi:hypothetical protein
LGNQRQPAILAGLLVGDSRLQHVELGPEQRSRREHKKMKRSEQEKV